ncbi:MAG: hypothetical protein AB7T06_17560 [Kofleriaceae bacterium]
MRLLTLPKVLLVGAAGAYVLHRARSSTARRARRDANAVPPPDPADPVQSLYSETDPAIELDTPAETTLDTVNETVADVGDLYGVHTAPAEDKTHPDDDTAMREGQNWLEALQTDAVEGGTEPEREIEMADDAEIDRPPHASDTRDTPVADRGSGGPAGT